MLAQALLQYYLFVLNTYAMLFGASRSAGAQIHHYEFISQRDLLTCKLWYYRVILAAEHIKTFIFQYYLNKIV